MSDEFDVVRRIGSDTDAPADALDRVWRRVSTEMHSEPATQSHPRPATLPYQPVTAINGQHSARRPSRRPARGWRWAATAAAIVLVVLAAGALVRRGEPTDVVSEPAEVTLSSLADAAGNGPDLALGPGQFAYLETFREGPPESNADTGLFARTQTRLWWAADDSGREAYTESYYRSPSDPATTVAPYTADNRYGAGDMRIAVIYRYADVRQMPTDAGQLQARLEDGARDPLEARATALMRITELLSFPSTPPEVRRTAISLLRQYGAQPGPRMRVAGSAEGASFSIAAGEQTFQFVFDPPSGLLLGTVRGVAGGTGPSTITTRVGERAVRGDDG